MIGLKEIKSQRKIKNPFKRRRIKERLSQQEVAVMMGDLKSQKLVSNMELGKNVSVSTLERWAEAFDLTWNQMVNLIRKG